MCALYPYRLFKFFLANTAGPYMLRHVVPRNDNVAGIAVLKAKQRTNEDNLATLWDTVYQNA